MKKIFGIPMALFVVGLLVIGGASALVVNYLSNTATANVTVESPMTIQFAEVNHVESTPANAIDLVADGSVDWVDSIILSGTTALSTVGLGVKVENNADVSIAGKYLEFSISNSINDVDCDDLSSLTFIDVGASPGTSEYQVVQELTGLGLCVDYGESVAYYIPITLLGAESTFKYPVTLTFGVVAPADYSFSAVLLNTLPSV